jgi:hypothetical protein
MEQLNRAIIDCNNGTNVATLKAERRELCDWKQFSIVLNGSLSRVK